MTDKPKFTRDQLDEWQRKDQRKRQESAERLKSATDDPHDGVPLWLIDARG